MKSYWDDWYEEGTFNKRVRGISNLMLETIIRKDLSEKEKTSNVEFLTELQKEEHKTYFALNGRTKAKPKRKSGVFVQRILPTLKACTE